MITKKLRQKQTTQIRNKKIFNPREFKKILIFLRDNQILNSNLETLYKTSHKNRLIDKIIPNRKKSIRNHRIIMNQN